MTKTIMSTDLIFSLILVGFIHHAKGYSSGPPSSLCNGMALTAKPHGSPQTSSSPFYITIDKTSIGVGQTITGTLSGSSTFEGYMIEAKDSLGNIYGSFTNIGANMQTINCGSGQALGHTSATFVQSITFTWVAPSSISGTSIQLTFYYIGMKSRTVHWSNVASGAVFTVSSSVTSTSTSTSLKPSTSTTKVLSTSTSSTTTPSTSVISSTSTSLASTSTSLASTSLALSTSAPPASSDTSTSASTLPFSTTHDYYYYYDYSESSTPNSPFTTSSSSMPSTTATTADLDYYYDYFDISTLSSTLSPSTSAYTIQSTFTTSSSSVPDTSPNSQNSTTFTNVYSQCGSSIGCYGSDKDCISSKSCGLLMTYRYDANSDSFDLGMFSNMVTDQSNYISIALSFDENMGDDLVFACSPSFASIKTSWNIGYDNSNDVSGVKIIDTLISNTGTSLACSFSIPATFNISGAATQSFDLTNKNYFLMTAQGINENNETIGMHNERSSSNTAVTLKVSKILQSGKSNLLLQIHGALMAVAWLGCVPVGMILARYFKPLCPNTRPLGLSCWLLSHQVTSYSATLLTLIGMILSFVAVGSKSLSMASLQINPHSVVGLLTCIMTCIQVVYGFFRPGSASNLRSCFVWTHWTMGNTTFVLGIVSIFLSINLAKLRMSNKYYSALIIYVIATAITYGILERFRMSGRNSEMIPEVETAEKVENMRMTLRNIVGLIYLGFCLCFSLALIVGIFTI